MTDTPATAAPPQTLVPTIGMPQASFAAIALAAKHGLAHLAGQAFKDAANALIAAEEAIANGMKAEAAKLEADAAKAALVRDRLTAAKEVVAPLMKDAVPPIDSMPAMPGT